MSNIIQLKKLSILPPNKTVVFYSPIDGKDTLVRTGTIGDGSCLYHSILHAYSKDYILMNKNDRMIFVSKLRKSMSSKISRDRWESLSEGLIAKITFQENINVFLTEFYNYINKKIDGNNYNSYMKSIVNELIVDDNSKETYQVILELLPLEKTFEQTILPAVYNTHNNSSISQIKNIIIKYSLTYLKKILKDIDGLSDGQIKYYLKYLEKMLIKIINEAESFSYNNYISKLENSSIDVDPYTIGLISDKFNRDIYFIDSSTRMPYRDANIKNIKNRKSLIVMWTGGCHYEIVGKLLPGNKIKREFEHTDSIIRRINIYLNHPERVPKLYPNLVPYLPRKVKRDLGIIEKKIKRRNKIDYRDDGIYVDSDEENSDDTDFDKSDVDKSDDDTDFDDIYINLKYKPSTIY